MAHYDCSNCGSYMGVAFGYCDDCTPKEYKDITHELNGINASALLSWSNETYFLKQQYLKAFKKQEREALEARLKQIEEEHKY